MSAIIKFAKINPKAIIPTKRDEDAGYDIYPCFNDNYIRIPSHCTVMIPTGIASNCSYDYIISCGKPTPLGVGWIALYFKNNSK